MSRLPKSAVFLERAGYRQRRLRDAARLLPILGAVLWTIPLLWGRQGDDSPRANTVIYIFVVWVLLIVLAAVISMRLQPDAPAADGDAAD